MAVMPMTLSQLAGGKKGKQAAAMRLYIYI
jgi:hypothetical protein